jgi:hypothetical protein
VALPQEVIVRRRSLELKRTPGTCSGIRCTCTAASLNIGFPRFTALPAAVPFRSFPTMKKLPIFSLALCVAAAWLYFTPYMAVNKLQAAAERGDAEALNEMVDFPTLRTSIKSEIQGAASRGVQRDGGVFAAVAAAATGMVVDPVVNAAVTPQGISMLMKGQRPRRGNDDSADGDSWRDDVKISRRWESPDKFVIHYSDRASGDERIALVMRRDGLDWRLSGVRFPTAAEK